jgi:hypothetical protein
LSITWYAAWLAKLCWDRISTAYFWMGWDPPTTRLNYSWAQGRIIGNCSLTAVKICASLFKGGVMGRNSEKQLSAAPNVSTGNAEFPLGTEVWNGSS